MKERSVVFYKRLIVSSALVIVFAFAFFVGLAVSGILSEKPDGAPDAEKNDATNETSVTEEPAAIEETTADSDEEYKVYLTFDDGSSAYTEDILALLRKKDVRATFFFNMNENFTPDDVVAEAFEDGHVIGVLTSTSSYGSAFESVQTFEEDIKATINRIENLTGKTPKIGRIPGGTINCYTQDIYPELLDVMQSNGLVSFDWNVCADNGRRNASEDYMVENGTRLPQNRKECVVLIHDNGNENICRALERIIDFYENQGYMFDVLTKNTELITFV